MKKKNLIIIAFIFTLLSLLSWNYTNKNLVETSESFKICIANEMNVNREIDTVEKQDLTEKCFWSKYNNRDLNAYLKLFRNIFGGIAIFSLFVLMLNKKLE